MAIERVEPFRALAMLGQTIDLAMPGYLIPRLPSVGIVLPKLFSCYKRNFPIKRTNGFESEYQLFGKRPPSTVIPTGGEAIPWYFVPLARMQAQV